MFLRGGLVRRTVDLYSGRWCGLGGDRGGGRGGALVGVLVEPELLGLHCHLAQVVVRLGPACIIWDNEVQ